MVEKVPSAWDLEQIRRLQDTNSINNSISKQEEWAKNSNEKAKENNSKFRVYNRYEYMFWKILGILFLLFLIFSVVLFLYLMNNDKLKSEISIFPSFNSTTNNKYDFNPITNNQYDFKPDLHINLTVPVTIKGCVNST